MRITATFRATKRVPILQVLKSAVATIAAWLVAGWLIPGPLPVFAAIAYFNHTRSALLHDGRHPRVVMQVFQRRQAMLGGMDEALAILELCSDDWEGLTVHALRDGDRVEVEGEELVVQVEGD